MRKHVIPAILALLCAVMTLALPVTAAEAEPPAGSNYELTLRLEVDHPIFHDNLPLEGVTYHLYKVGEFKSLDNTSLSVDYTPTEDFEDAFGDTWPTDESMSLEGLDFWNTWATILMTMAEELAKYVEDKQISTIRTGTTNEKGIVTFTGLDAGLYLALGDPLSIDFGGPDRTWIFLPQATLVPVPFWDLDGKWISAVNVDVKAEQDPPPEQNELIDVSVRKVWEGSVEHPDSVTVELLMDGREIDDDDAFVELNEGNDWRHTWEKLSSGNDWTVREVVPSGWEADITQEGNVFTITNRPKTSSTPDDPTPTPDDPPPTPDDPTSTPDDPNVPTPSGNPTAPDVPPILSDLPNVTDESRLPQTGQLWWPAPLLVAVGVPLLLIGAVMFVRKEESEEFEELYE